MPHFAQKICSHHEDFQEQLRRYRGTARQARIAGARTALQEGKVRRAVLGGLGALALTGTIITTHRRSDS